MRMGKPTETILKRSVLIPVSRKSEDLLTTKKPGMDSAVLAWKDEELVLASASEVLEPGGDWSVFLCCEKVCNNLYAAGAEPISFQVQLLLPPEMEEPQLKQIMRALRRFCDREQITVAGGQTEITDAVKKPVLAITSVGKKPEDFPLQSVHKKVHDGDAIVMSKYLAVEGTWWMVHAHSDRMKERFSASFLEKGTSFFNWLSVKEEARIAVESGAAAMHDVSRGGLFAALWELSAREGMGIVVDLKRIPVKQETIEYCEVLGLNPYYLAGTGALLMVTPDGEALAEKLTAAGISAEVIGHMAAGNDKLVINGDEVRSIDPPLLDERFKVTA